MSNYRRKLIMAVINSVKSCFGKGLWSDDAIWSDNDGWKE